MQSGDVAQAALIATRPLGSLPTFLNIGPFHHIHIFFEDGREPPNIGFMGSQGLGQDSFANRYSLEEEGLDDARMRLAVKRVGDPGPYNLATNNCQHYVSRVLEEYSGT